MVPQSHSETILKALLGSMLKKHQGMHFLLGETNCNGCILQQDRVVITWTEGPQPETDVGTTPAKAGRRRGRICC
jgi:hypothetical protein